MLRIFKSKLTEGEIVIAIPVRDVVLVTGLSDVKNIGNGVDLRYIQELLGHGSSYTTEIYMHVSKISLANISSPLDCFIDSIKHINKALPENAD